MTAELFTLHTRPDGRLAARTDPRFWNQIGPFGGWLAGTALAAMRREVEPSFKPRSFSAQFFGSFAAGEIELDVRVLRRQRTVVAVQVELSQDGQAGVSAQALFGSDRAGQPALGDPAPPELATPGQLSRWHGLDAFASFTRQFDYRPALGVPFAGGQQRDSGGWLRLIDDEGWSAEHLLLLADAWCPALWAAVPAPVPVSTLSMNVLFHGEPPAAPPHRFLAAHHHTHSVAEGYGDERGALWWPDGRLAVLAQQSTWVDFGKAHQNAA
jgi:acyl-CoA thioesterase